MTRFERSEPSPRRVIDECGRTWRVHEIAVASCRAHGDGRLVGRIYSCDAPGPIPELRRPWRPPDHAGEGGPSSART